MKVKTNCNWYRARPRSECKVLGELVCAKKEKCTFFETETDFKARQKSFEKICGKGQHTKKCSRCHIVKDVGEFTKHKGSADGLDCYCRECKKEINKNRRKSNLSVTSEHTSSE